MLCHGTSNFTTNFMKNKNEMIDKTNLIPDTIFIEIYVNSKCQEMSFRICI